MIILSVLVSIPITYYTMSRWLQTFEYNAGIGWQVFIIAGAVSLFITIITISYHAVKTAVSQPAQMLKNE